MGGESKRNNGAPRTEDIRKNIKQILEERIEYWERMRIQYHTELEQRLSYLLGMLTRLENVSISSDLWINRGNSVTSSSTSHFRVLKQRN